MRRYLRDREAQIPREARPLRPLAAPRLVVPVPGAHDLADPLHLVDLVASREQGLKDRDLDAYCTDGLDVDGRRVLACAQQHLRGAIPPRGDVGRVGSFECVSRARPKSAILTVYVGGVDGGVTSEEYLRNE